MFFPIAKFVKKFQVKFTVLLVIIQDLLGWCYQIFIENLLGQFYYRFVKT